MSAVTNLILAISSGEKPKIIQEQIKKFTIRGNPFVIVWVEDESLPKYWYGGSKVLECRLFIGAYNHLDLNLLIKFLREEMQWEDPEVVQLIVKEHEDDKFKIINVFPELQD